MRLLLFFFLIHTGVLSFGQSRCVTSTYLEGKGQENAATAKRIREAEAFLKKSSTQRAIFEDAIIQIPVVVHVLYQPSQNISDAQIRSGIDALNRDFRMKNADTSKTPQQFRALAADVQIEFYLAKTDPQGRKTTGIERKATSRNGWLADDKIKLSSQGGMDAWDSRSYLNIWIGNLIGGSGYSSVPGSDAKTDGIVIQYSAFGTINTGAPFNLGRTAVHEVGHWLGLKHIWGDAPCGDDLVEDTPQQGFFTQGCPSGIRSSCNNGTAGDMYMNYMDYTNDACMNLFTKGQRQRMRSAFDEGGPRASLLQSKGLHEPWVNEAVLPTPAAALYPNPALNKITLQTGSNQLGESISLLNSQGQLIRVEKIKALQQSFDVQALKAGVYFLKGNDFMYKFIKL